MIMKLTNSVIRQFFQIMMWYVVSFQVFIRILNTLRSQNRLDFSQSVHMENFEFYKFKENLNRVQIVANKDQEVMIYIQKMELGLFTLHQVKLHQVQKLSFDYIEVKSQFY